MTDQIITPVLNTETASPGDIITIDVNYETADPSEAPALGTVFRLHWDSSQLEFDPATGLENIFPFGVQPTGGIEEDVEDFDGDPDTDKYFIQSWIDTSNSWPNLLDPAPTLYTASFTALEGFSGSTIDFSSDLDQLPPDFEFVSTSATIEGEGAPPPPQIFDVIQGTSDDDTREGTPQNNVLIGLAGDDILNAIGGEDILFGGSGDDNLDGGMGDDLIYGGQGNDLILGGSGNDTLIGEAGQDFMLGGSGSDLFVFSGMGATQILAQVDVLVDFNVAEDTIGLDGGLTRGNIELEGLGTNTAVKLAFDGGIIAILNRVRPDQLTDNNFQSANIGLF